MPKQCAVEGCTHRVFSKKHCLWHQYIINPPHRINPISETQAERLKIYKPLSKKFLRENRVCGANLEGCQVKANQVHHKRGRGKYTNDVSTFLAVCKNCHDIIHDVMSMDEAVKRGLRIKQN